MRSRFRAAVLIVEHQIDACGGLRDFHSGTVGPGTEGQILKMVG